MKKLKHIKEYHSYKRMTDKPVEKYPVDYKCTFIYDIAEKLEKKGIDVTNLGEPHKKPSGYSRGNSLYSWIHKKWQLDNTIYPNQRIIDLFPKYTDYKIISEGNQVVLLPKHYDSSRDEEIEGEENKRRFLELVKNGEKIFKNEPEKLKQFIENINKHVDFGVESYDWVNIALSAIYEEYKQYYIGDFLRVWLPKDWDCDNSFSENDGENTTYGYPIKKMIFLSELEEYLKTNYGLSDELFYQFIIHNNYIEGREWENPAGLSCDNDKKFKRKGGKYGMDATETIDMMLGIIETEFGDLIKDDYLNIYIDYYKKIESKY